MLMGRQGEELWPPAYQVSPISSILGHWMMQLGQLPGALIRYPIKLSSAIIAERMLNMGTVVTPYLSGTVVSTQTAEAHAPLFENFSLDLIQSSLRDDGFGNWSNRKLISRFEHMAMSGTELPWGMTWKHSHCLTNESQTSGLVYSSSLDIDAEFLTSVGMGRGDFIVQSRAALKKLQLTRKKPEEDPIARLTISGGTVDFLGHVKDLDWQGTRKYLKALARKQRRDFNVQTSVKLTDVKGTFRGIDFSISAQLETDGTFLSVGPPMTDPSNEEGERFVGRYHSKDIKLTEPDLRLTSWGE